MSLSTAKSQSSKLSPEPWLAVNLSMFFPGIGQLYAGERLRGLGFIGSQLVIIAIASWSIFSPSGNTVTGLSCLFLSLIIYIFNLFDTYACVNKQLDIQVSEKIPRINKNPWFAVFLSRILPGLGQFYLEKSIIGGLFLSLIIIFSSLASIIPNLLLVVPITSAVACYHAFVAFPQRRRQKRELITILALCVLIFGLAASYIPTWIKKEIEIFEIPSTSMLPTLEVGDRIFVNKSSSYSPQRGDVMVFKEPDAAKLLESEEDSKKERFFVKRVIGEPGQVLRIADGVVYVDDQPLQEAYIKEPPAYEWGPEPIPAESYFVMGDNRNKSFDSHVWGVLPKRYVVGQAYKVYWPPERIQPLIRKN